MNRKIILFALLILNSIVLKSQNIEWIKSIGSLPYRTHKLYTDHEKNLYILSVKDFYYQSFYNKSYSEDTTGTCLEKYDPSGKLLFKKHFKPSFQISELLFMENELYFTGVFSGAITLDNQHLQSRGKTDGMLGKMSREAEILWMKSLGGRELDYSFGICNMPSQQSIAITGGVSDSLFFENDLLGTGEQSLFYMILSKDGHPEQYHLYDPFDSTWFYGNVGLNILSDKNSSLYILHHREGRWWSNDPDPVPEAGYYEMKLDAGGTIIWDEMRIPVEQHYYGWRCTPLKTDGSGSTYLGITTNGKYGHWGFVGKYFPYNGQPEWHHSGKEECTYADLSIHNNSIYMVGTEEENNCPCPESHPGFEVIKRIDLTGKAEWSMKLKNISLRSISPVQDNTFYVLGSMWSNSLLAGEDTIQTEKPGFQILKISEGQPLLVHEDKDVPVLRVFPNPGKNFCFEVSNTRNELLLKVYSVLGSQIGVWPVNPGRTFIDLEACPQGLYIVSLQDRAGKTLQKMKLSVIR